MKRTHAACLTLALSLVVALPLPALAAANADALPALVEEAMNHNPDLQAAQARWEMFEQKVTPAQSLDDPRLGLALSNYPVDSFQGDQTPMTGNELQLSQTFPFPGKLAAKGEIAEQAGPLVPGGLRRCAACNWPARSRMPGTGSISRTGRLPSPSRICKLLDQLIRLTETRYEVGDGLQQDVLKAQLERSKLMDRLFSQRQQRTSVVADLNTLLGRDPNSPFAPLPELSPTVVGQNVAALQQLAQGHRPLFKSYQSLIDRYRSQRKLAKLDYYPNFNLWTSYRFRDDNLPDGGTDFVSAGVSINLPLWREKRSAGVAEAENGVRMAQRQFDDFRNQVRFASRTLCPAGEESQSDRSSTAAGSSPRPSSPSRPACPPTRSARSMSSTCSTA